MVPHVNEGRREVDERRPRQADAPWRLFDHQSDVGRGFVEDRGECRAMRRGRGQRKDRARRSFRRANQAASVTRRLQLRDLTPAQAGVCCFASVQEPLLCRFWHSDEHMRTLLNRSAQIQHSEIALPKPGVRGSSPLRDASYFNSLSQDIKFGMGSDWARGNARVTPAPDNVATDYAIISVSTRIAIRSAVTIKRGPWSQRR
jgi:hypothetical protein